jgi:copper oxidase (laccase) domain-containing protein
MIAKDQPTIFEPQVTVAVSSVDDGNMKFGLASDEATLLNRQRFLKANDISIDQATLLSITYDRSDYAEYRIVSSHELGRAMRRPESIAAADGLVTNTTGHALFLPIADCCGVVLHDPAKNVLMLSHIGRHSAEVDGGFKSVRFLQENCNSAPAGLKVWLSPAVGKATYPIAKKDGRGLHELIVGQLLQAGVLMENIEVCKIDTATDPDYFSHSQFKAGKQAGVDGRFAVVAMMRGRGEPAV